MSVGGANNNLYVTPGSASQAWQPLASTSRDQACYGLDPQLEGIYSGIHNGDNITPKSSEDFQRRVGKTDIELKFLNLEGGWVFPWEETSLLTSQGRAIFIKLEPFIPSPIDDKWERVEFNYSALDNFIPKDYYRLLLDLSTLIRQSPADLENQCGILLQKYGITNLQPSELAARAKAIKEEYFSQALTAVLQKGKIDPSQFSALTVELQQETEKANAALLARFSALLRENKIEPNPNLLNQLVSKAKTDGNPGDLMDLKQQFLSILMQYRIDPTRHSALINQLAATASSGFDRLMGTFKAVLLQHGISRPDPKFVRQLAKKARGEYDHFVLQFDLFLRQQKVASRFEADYDNIVRQNALKAKTAATPILEAFAPEMNGFGGGRYFYPFGIDPVKYILAYRHIHAVESSAGANNIRHVWNPHVIRRYEKDFTEYYPGHDFVDIIAFDTYCEEESPNCSQLVDYLKNAITTMDSYLDERGLPHKRYAVGEWGASNSTQFDEMLAYLNKNKNIKFNIYYNVNERGYYKMNPKMEKRYQQYLKKLNADRYNFEKTNYPNNPDIKPYICPLPQVPDPWQINRSISDAEFLSPAELEQKVCSPELKDFVPVCLVPFPPGWHPDTNQPMRSLTPDQFYPIEQKYLDASIGHIFDYGVHAYQLNAQKITTKLDKQELKLETLERILQAAASSPLAPFDQHNIDRETFFKQHPELAKIREFAPNFGDYLQQPKFFWENLVILYNIYIQKIIEKSDEEALNKAVVMGEKLREKIMAQDRYEIRVCTSESFVPFKYRLAFFSSSLAEAYSQLRDAPLEQYERGLLYTEEAINDFKGLSVTSRPDYFSISKLILTAADLHSKLAQQLLRQSYFDRAKEHYLSAKSLCDSIAQLDYKQGIGLSVVPAFRSSIAVKASAPEMIQALRDNEEMYYLNHPEAIASTHGIFRFLRGLALLKQAAFYIEFAFKPFNQYGYQDVIQNLVYIKSGLEEIAEGSPFADLRYFRAWGNLLTSKLIIQLADSLSYSTSNLPEAEARRIHIAAMKQLKKNLPDLMPAAGWEKIEQTLSKPNECDEKMVKSEMDHLKQITKEKVPYKGGERIKDITTPDYLVVTEKLLRQTHTTYDYRMAFAEQAIELSQNYLNQTKAQLAFPNRFGIDDKMKDKTPVLYAELLLLESNLDLRRSEFIYFTNKKKILDQNKNELKQKEDSIKAYLEKITEADQQLPESSYLKIELALTRATLELSLETFHHGAEYRRSIYKTIDLLSGKPPIFTADNPDPTYQVIKSLEGLRARIMAQPEPNRTILLTQLETKLSLAYIILAANTMKSFPGRMNYCIKVLDEKEGGAEWQECKKATTYARQAVKISGRILLDLEAKIDGEIKASADPLMFNLTDFRTELHHQLAIVSAFLDDKPEMQHYLALAKEENIASGSRFNVLYRSWILNQFAIPEPRHGFGRSNLPIHFKKHPGWLRERKQLEIFPVFPR